MSNNESFNADGQVIFIEPRWVTGETCLFTVGNLRDYMYGRTHLTKMRKAFVSKLEKKGFKITYDKNDIDENTICLIMNEDVLGLPSNCTMSDYKKAFDKRIFEKAGEKLNYPHTVRVEEYFENPFFPAVFKNEGTNGGVDKFLIENESQLETIKKLYRDYASNPTIANAFSLSVFQQLIETPTNHKTYMRVLMSSSGDVMGASLKYSIAETKVREPEGVFEKIFWDENSEYYLGCRGMFNYYSGGGNIHFSQPRFSTEKSKILALHGLDPYRPEVPDDVLEVASNIASKGNEELGIMCGIDFILNEADNKWYYLEIQAFPAIEEWAVTKGIRKIKEGGIEEYMKYCELDLEARHDALMMHMNKKKSQGNSDNKPKTLVLTPTKKQ